ncbi:MAG: hypothetical protein SNI70_10910 [Rikenellaceae bacterium]
MSFQSWHTYGYGICVDHIDTTDITKLQALLTCAPKLNAEIQQHFLALEIDTPTWDDYMDFDEDYQLGLATILQRVISEAEGIELVACDDFENSQYLLYPPRYPWSMSSLDHELTEETIAAILHKYCVMLTDTPIEIDYEAPENGG